VLSNRAARYRPSAETDPDHDATHRGGAARIAVVCSYACERTLRARIDRREVGRTAGMDCRAGGQAAKVAAATEDPVDVTSLAPRRWPTSTDPMLLENCPVPLLTVNVPKATVEPSST
jgi:hypothetical protein